MSEENEVEDSGELIYSKHEDDDVRGHLSVENLKQELLYKKMKNLTVGYLTAIKGELKVRQGLAVSGAFTMALEEVSFFHQTWNSTISDIAYKNYKFRSLFSTARTN